MEVVQADQSLRLMLVDDEPCLTDFLGVELEEEGYIVQIVSNISEAWQALQAELLPFAAGCVFFRILFTIFVGRDFDTVSDRTTTLNRHVGFPMIIQAGYVRSPTSVHMSSSEDIAVFIRIHDCAVIIVNS